MYDRYFSGYFSWRCVRSSDTGLTGWADLEFVAGNPGLVICLLTSETMLLYEAPTHLFHNVIV